MLKVFKYKLRPNRKQSLALQHTLDVCRIKLKNIISACEQYKQDAVASARACVEEGGGIWVGVQQCEGLAALALFNSPETGSTLAITLAAITPDLVRSRIEKSNKEFAYYQARKR